MSNIIFDEVFRIQGMHGNITLHDVYADIYLTWNMTSILYV